jgi:hypothetical protein
MRKASLFLAVSFFLLSCKKEKVEVTVINPSPSAIQIMIDQVINDSIVILKWTKYTGNNFQKYKLVRNAMYLKNGQFTNFRDSLYAGTDINYLSHTDNTMPLARDINYELYVSKDTTKYNQGFIQVASVYYERPNSLVSGIPKDVLINVQQQKLYVTQDYSITIVDYNSGRAIKTRQFPSGINYCSLGDFNNIKELYVPTEDGWVLILDATTLQEIDKIYVAGYGVGSVVAINGILFVSSSDRTQGGIYDNCVKTYDRATKSFIGRTGYWDRTRLTALEGTSVELIDLTINLIPVDLCYYQFSPAGVPITKKQDLYHGTYAMDAGIVRSFPDGSKFITSSSGTIFDKSLVFDRYVKQYGNFSDFAFNADGSQIYAAYGQQKKIDVITYPALNTVNSYTTSFYPYKIFRIGNTMICANRTHISQQFTYLLFEKINL